MLERFHLAIAVVTIVAATVFLLALTIMLVDERRETVGVLRLIGLPVRRILAQILLEGLLVAGVGAAFGLALALLSERLINQFFQWRYDTALVFVRVTKDVALDLRGHRRPARRIRHRRRLVGPPAPRRTAGSPDDERARICVAEPRAAAGARGAGHSRRCRRRRAAASTCCCSRVA